MNKKKTLESLNCQKRELLNKLEKIDKQIDRIENEKLIITGKLRRRLSLFIQGHTEDTRKLNTESYESMVLYLDMYRYKNEIRCEITSNGEFIPKDVKFIGVAICSKDDEFKLTTGLNLAQKRAEIELDKYIVEMIQDEKSSYYL